MSMSHKVDRESSHEIKELFNLPPLLPLLLKTGHLSDMPFARDFLGMH